ncbi:molybdate ABC transporter ATP-binding protein ModF [Pasteurellaceae bacterium Pebbles2]|nr:molybdate ABC transporter ATP-binding protein ModF [Pasteurellaceae bacterium Pebbles2]
MSVLSLLEAQFSLAQYQHLNVDEMNIQQGEFWVIVGSNGSGKTALAQALAKELTLVSGEYRNTFQKISLLSFEHQRKILEKILRDLNNDEDPDVQGLTARQVILDNSKNFALCEDIAQKLHITHLLDRAYLQLSTGESRKVLFAKALVSQPDLLILDEPFEGLDQASLQYWQEMIRSLCGTMTLVLISNRFEDIPDCATHIALLENLQLILKGKRQEIEQNSLYTQLKYATENAKAPLPSSVSQPISLENGVNPFELSNVNIQYGDKKILQNLSWTVAQKQNWWIKGPNGAGKSTLLSIITGDHPQAFANSVKLFGKQRGSGETIWDIKQHIGYVSTQLHNDYRVNCSALDVILSGFFDSIGVYQKVPESLRLKAVEWLERLNLSAVQKKPFRSLSWGQQRLLLITRAMVKHPPILILDEPLQGLDALNRQLVKQFIEQLVNNSQTQLLFVSHQDSDAPNCLTNVFEFIADNGSYRYEQRILKKN